MPKKFSSNMIMYAAIPEMASHFEKAAMNRSYTSENRAIFNYMADALKKMRVFPEMQKRGTATNRQKSVFKEQMKTFEEIRTISTANTALSNILNEACDIFIKRRNDMLKP